MSKVKDVVTREEKEMMKKFAEGIAPEGWVFGISEEGGYYPESDNPNAVLVDLDIRGKEDETEHYYHGATKNFEYFYKRPYMSIMINAALWNTWKISMVYQIAAGQAFVIAGKELGIPDLKDRVHSMDIAYILMSYPQYIKMIAGKGKRFKAILQELIKRGEKNKVLKVGEIKNIRTRS